MFALINHNWKQAYNNVPRYSSVHLHLHVRLHLFHFCTTTKFISKINLSELYLPMIQFSNVWSLFLCAEHGDIIVCLVKIFKRFETWNWFQWWTRFLEIFNLRWILGARGKQCEKFAKYDTLYICFDNHLLKLSCFCIPINSHTIYAYIGIGVGNMLLHTVACDMPLPVYNLYLYMDNLIYSPR